MSQVWITVIWTSASKVPIFPGCRFKTSTSSTQTPSRFSRVFICRSSSSVTVRCSDHVSVEISCAEQIVCRSEEMQAARVPFCRSWGRQPLKAQHRWSEQLRRAPFSARIPAGTAGFKQDQIRTIERRAGRGIIQEFLNASIPAGTESKSRYAEQHFGSDRSRSSRLMSALPKPWEMYAHTRRRRVRALHSSGPIGANHGRKRCNSGSIAARLGGSLGGSLSKSRGCQPQHK